MIKQKQKTEIKINNQRISKNFYIFLFIFLAFGFWPLVFTTPKAQATSLNEKTLIELVNQERRARGIPILTVDYRLYNAALTKANDMISKDYFEHYSPDGPDGRSPWDFITKNGYNYLAAGENLSMDFITCEANHTAWMASPTHRANILNPSFEDIGVALVKGDFAGYETNMVVQMFGRPDYSFAGKVNSLVTKITNFLLGF